MWFSEIRHGLCFNRHNTWDDYHFESGCTRVGNYYGLYLNDYAEYAIGHGVDYTVCMSCDWDNFYYEEREPGRSCTCHHDDCEWERTRTDCEDH
jgi:hypothetical protein